ncbi:MAG: alpha/beta hydrolase [Spirochaetales bacterium]|nr:alpha/beta hydrolase [Spirochaetales bacterium]MCF7938100.1 alpha/beta hydrolase [Spirochaetales bacterium]
MKPKVAGVVAGALVLLGGCSTDGSSDTDKPGQISGSLYKSSEGKAVSHASYDRAMELWDVAYTEDWVETGYGVTHLIVCGPEEAQPIFLLPGLFADATMWYANAGALAEQYRVYALDLPVYGGKSRPAGQKIKTVKDYTRWFTALLDHYGYEKTAAAGLSYGSWLSLALAREIPDSLSALVLLDPSETFAKMRKIMIWKGFRYFVFFPNRAKYAKFFDWMGGGYTDPESEVWFEHMLDVIEYGSVGMMDVPQHRVYEPGELTMVTMPVLILAGGKPIIYKNPEAFAAAAARALPHAEIEIVPDTGHSLNMEKPAAVNRRMLSFLAEHYR